MSEFSAEYPSSVFLFGEQAFINQISRHKTYLESEANISLIGSDSPESEIIVFLKDNKIDAAIRGSLSSSTFLRNLKDHLGVSGINRLALLETFKEQQFFFGPVGIDECNNLKDKISFIETSWK